MLEKNQLLNWCLAHDIQSIYELAKRTTVHRQMLYRINNGNSSPTMELLGRLSKEVGLITIIKEGKIQFI